MHATHTYRYLNARADAEHQAQVLNALVARLLASDGTFCTGTAGPIAYVRGYQVGLWGLKVHQADPHASGLVRDFLENAVRQDVRDVGSWTAEDGVVHVDASVYVSGREAAFALARNHGQLAIWDWAGNRSISLATMYPKVEG